MQTYHYRVAQRGAAAIGLAMLLSVVVVSGSYLINQEITNTSTLVRKADISSELTLHSLRTLEQAAQAIQSGALSIDAANMQFFDSSKAFAAISDGGLGWELVSSAKARNSFCNPRFIEASINSLLNSDPSELTCTDDRKISMLVDLDEIQEIDETQGDGSTVTNSYARLSINTSFQEGGKTYKNLQRTRVKVPSIGVGGECPYIDPTMNPPATAQPYSTANYVAVGRAYVGWVRVSLPADQPRGGGYAGTDIRHEFSGDPRCGSHACGYWAPSTPDMTRRAWLAYLGGLTVAVRLNIPVGNESACFLTFHPNRRPRRSWNSGCFAEGTQIRMADQSLKAVELLEEGDQVYNPVTRKAQVVKRTIAGPEEEPMVDITMAERVVRVSSKHPFFTESGLIAAKELKAGDRIISHGGRYRVIDDVTKVEHEHPPTVYNFALVDGGEGSDLAHMVEANGIVTGDLWLQEKVSGLDPTKRTYTPSIKPYVSLLTDMMRKKDATP